MPSLPATRPEILTFAAFSTRGLMPTRRVWSGTRPPAPATSRQRRNCVLSRQHFRPRPRSSSSTRPQYHYALPPPGTEAAYRDARMQGGDCRRGEGPRESGVLDWRVDRPENHEAELFFDMGHYRQPLARHIEADIAKASKRMQ